MNLKNWTKQHTFGLLIGLGTILLAIPLILLILSYTDNRDFHVMWLKFKISHAEKTRVISISCITNLLWFHTFLKRKKYSFAYGVIASTFCFLFVILYYKFLA